MFKWQQIHTTFNSLDLWEACRTAYLMSPWQSAFAESPETVPKPSCCSEWRAPHYIQNTCHNEIHSTIGTILMWTAGYWASGFESCSRVYFYRMAELTEWHLLFVILFLVLLKQSWDFSHQAFHVLKLIVMQWDSEWKTWWCLTACWIPDWVQPCKTDSSKYFQVNAAQSISQLKLRLKLQSYFHCRCSRDQVWTPNLYGHLKHVDVFCEAICLICGRCCHLIVSTVT